MKTAYRINWLTAAALLLALPTGYFVLTGLLSEFGINGPADALQPTLEKLGSKESLGWNINLLIVFGPVIALLICATQVLKLNFRFTKEEFELHAAIKKSWFALFVALLSVTSLATLFLYLLAENCNC